MYSLDSTVKFHDQPVYALIVSVVGKGYTKLQFFIKVIQSYKLLYIDLNDTIGWFMKTRVHLVKYQMSELLVHGNAGCIDRYPKERQCDL